VPLNTNQPTAEEQLLTGHLLISCLDRKNRSAFDGLCTDGRQKTNTTVGAISTFNDPQSYNVRIAGYSLSPAMLSVQQNSALTRSTFLSWVYWANKMHSSS